MLVMLVKLVCFSLISEYVSLDRGCVRWSGTIGVTLWTQQSKARRRRRRVALILGAKILYKNICNASVLSLSLSLYLRYLALVFRICFAS